jgi:deferrochelatase/peroxidase EfeB
MSDNVGKGFTLVMELEDPARLPELMNKLKEARPQIQASLASLDYVHYSRFIPLWNQGLLLIVTEFDGEMKDYVLDFAVVLDDEFSLILSYMKGYDKKHLPVSQHADQFWSYVDKYTGPKTIDPAHPFPPPYPDPFSVYEGKTALEIAGPLRVKRLPKAPARVSDPPVPLDDVQAHVLRSLHAVAASHLGFEFTDATQGRELLDSLLPLVSPESKARHEVCITLGLTHAGLQALGLPQQLLDRFPTAFREGPRLRSERLGDTGRNDPAQWRFAGIDSNTGSPVIVHGMVSIYRSANASELDGDVRRLRELLGDRASVCFEQRAQALGRRGEIHFGYRDGIGQPRFSLAKQSNETAATDKDNPAQRHDAHNRSISPVGDLLLGAAYRNSRGGYYIGELPEALATHGTYAALRVMEQHIDAFERLLTDVEQEHDVSRELLAAKLVGRWRNGRPLAEYPDEPAKDELDRVNAEAEKAPSSALDSFDYAGAHAEFDDREGRRCPFGAHIRRLNPRSGLALGVPWGRRIVRRGMPYGSKYDPKVPEERGLVGLFLCGDLESQFEFIQHVWANQDLSAPGLRHTQDPFSSAFEYGTPFSFRPSENDAEITITVPPLTTTRGSAYLFMPGIKGLQWIAQAGWNAPQ